MKYSTRSLTQRSHSGQLVSPPDTFSTDFVRDAAVGLTSVPDSEIVAAAFRILAKRVAQGSLIRNMEAAKQYLMLRFGELEYEIFAVVFLTVRHRVIACEELFRGTIDGASVHPREVIKAALRHNAASILIAHLHPSGDPTPSQADELITQRIKEAAALVDIRLIDHIITAGGSCTSLAEKGLL